jgi:hypothetical protein
MVEIGGCDYCGEFCSEVGLRSVEEFELASGWIPASAIERHCMWSERRYECDPDGEGHRGPLHDSRGRRLERCRHCYSPTHDLGGWDFTLDHSRCAECWVGVAGGRALRTTVRIRPGRAGDSSWTETELHRDPSAGSQSAAPVDHPRAERALRTYLGNSRLPVRWVPSPVGLAQALQDAIPDSGLPSDPDFEFPEPWSIWTLAPEGILELAESANRLPGAARAAAVAREVAVTESVDEGVDACLAEILMDAGQFDVRTPRVIAKVMSTPDRVHDGGFLRMLSELRWSAGPVLLCRGEVLVAERSLVFEVDAEGRLHSEDGPALAWADGLEVWSWHGVDMPEWVIREPDRITVDHIDVERNAEVRRVMIERFGPERLVRSSGGYVDQEDETGRLWRRRVGPVPPPAPIRRGPWGPPPGPPSPPVEHLVMVEVVNSTPEPDGTRKTYFLRVPPETRTAREGVAWTFGMSEAEYAPELET